MSEEQIWTLYFDGSSSSQLGAGAEIVLQNSTTERILYQKNLGRGLTCNQAEYAALTAGLRLANRLHITKIRIRGDSKLVCQQVKGDWEVKSTGLQTFHREILRLKENFRMFEIEHVPRKENAVADCLAKTASEGY